MLDEMLHATGSHSLRNALLCFAPLPDQLGSFDDVCGVWHAAETQSQS